MKTAKKGTMRINKAALKTETDITTKGYDRLKRCINANYHMPLLQTKAYCLIAGILNILFFANPSGAQDKEIVGKAEMVRIYPVNMVIRAKLDTGAKTSSLNVQHYTYFKRDGKTWVRFDLTKNNGKNIPMEKMVTRIVKIKRKGWMSQERPVILLGICLGHTYKEVEVNLVDRSNFRHMMLIGLNFLQGSFIIDPSLKYISKPECNKAGRGDE